MCDQRWAFILTLIGLGALRPRFIIGIAQPAANSDNNRTLPIDNNSDNKNRTLPIDNHSDSNRTLPIDNHSDNNRTFFYIIITVA